MSFSLKPGVRLFSAVCDTEMITVRAPSGDVDITIGGVPPVTSADGRTTGEVVSGHDGGVALGKRYVDDTGTVELLCIKPGKGVPAVDGNVLMTKDAKLLPASD